MLNITKGSPPKSFQAYRSHPAAAYDGQNFTPVKADLRAALVMEQHGLCAYCMRRIRPNERDMKIEHWQCQEKYPERQLNYDNLLGVCNGHEGKPRAQQTCDTRKRNEDLQFNPANPLHDLFGKIHYRTSDGAICSKDNDWDRQIGDENKGGRNDNDSILNLNLPILKEYRLAAIKAVFSSLSSKGTRKASELKQLIRKVEANEEWPEYAGVTLYYLQKRLERA